MSAEIIELLTRVAELERKLDSLFGHGPVHERKKIEKRWYVRLKMGGTDEKPFLSPWIPYSSPPGPSAEEMAENLKLHGIAADAITLKGDNRTSRVGDPRPRPRSRLRPRRQGRSIHRAGCGN